MEWPFQTGKSGISIKTRCSLFEKKVEQKELTPLYESILSGDTEKMEKILSENLMETISFYDYQDSYYRVSWQEC